MSWGVRVPVLAALLLAAGALSFGCGQEATVTQAPSGPAVGTRETAPSTTRESTRPVPISTANSVYPTSPPTVPAPTMSAANSEMPDRPCGPTNLGSRHHFLHWTPDGSQLVFDFLENIWTVDSEGTLLKSVVDANPGYWENGSGRRYRFPHGFHADLSPDGSRIVYGSCQYTLDDPYVEEAGSSGVFEYERLFFGYEIAAIAIDGTGQQRLTENRGFDSRPSWSPDGDRVAFIMSSNIFGDYDGTLRLHTMSPDDSDVTDVAGVVMGYENPSWSKSSLQPPVWSPDGRRLAFIGGETRDPSGGGTLYTIGADGSDRRILAYTESWIAPTWSPDGEELAFALVNVEKSLVNDRESTTYESMIYRIKADGTGLRKVWGGRSDEYSQTISRVSWSPGGSEIPFVTDGVYVVHTDGTGLRRLVNLRRIGEHLRDDLFFDIVRSSPWLTLAAWSPDGSRIAVYYAEGGRQHPESGGQLLTVARDGSDLRILVDRRVLGGEMQAWNSPQYERPPLDPAVCSAIFTAGEPETNAGLVQDCETLMLLGSQSLLRLRGSSWDEWWDPSRSTTWNDRLVIDGTPPRVRELGLGGIDLTLLPPELGRLTELRKLQMWNGAEYRFNTVTGGIPPEFGSLAKLEILDVTENYLSGRIPAELGNLGNLRVLFLGGNDLSGPIPAELGALKELRELSLNDNNLNGGIPPELGGLTGLESLDLSDNLFTGSIPPELGGLTGLESLDLSNNRLTGSIPPELGALESLTALNLAGNDFWGCIGDGWAEIWVRQSGRPPCEPEGGAVP